MELGELELAVLRAVRRLRTAAPRDIWREVRQHHRVAYTSVTTTLYRLVQKGFVGIRRERSGRVAYVVQEGRESRKAMAAMLDGIVGAFGEAAVSHVLRGPGGLTDAEARELQDRAARRRSKE